MLAFLWGQLGQAAKAGAMVLGFLLKSFSLPIGGCPPSRAGDPPFWGLASCKLILDLLKSLWKVLFVFNPVMLFQPSHCVSLLFSWMSEPKLIFLPSVLSGAKPQIPSFLIIFKPPNLCHLLLRIIHSCVHSSLSLISWLTLQFLNTCNQKQSKQLKVKMTTGMWKCQWIYWFSVLTHGH